MKSLTYIDPPLQQYALCCTRLCVLWSASSYALSSARSTVRAFPRLGLARAMPYFVERRFLVSQAFPDDCTCIARAGSGQSVCHADILSSPGALLAISRYLSWY